jgi:hypothetical protein
LWRETIILTKEIKKVPSPLPSIAIPMGIVTSEHLKTWAQITTIMMSLERAGTNAPTIKSDILTNHPHRIL